MQKNIHIGELPPEDKLDLTAATPEFSSTSRLGITVSNLEPEQREKLGIGRPVGVRVDKVQEGPASEAVSELPAGKSVAILVQRTTGPIFLALRVPEE